MKQLAECFYPGSCSTPSCALIWHNLGVADVEAAAGQWTEWITSSILAQPRQTTHHCLSTALSAADFPYVQVSTHAFIHGVVCEL